MDFESKRQTWWLHIDGKGRIVSTAATRGALRVLKPREKEGERVIEVAEVKATMTSRSDLLYSTDEHAERLYCTTPEEALAGAQYEFAFGPEDYPVTVYAWRRKVLTAEEIERCADDVIDDLEERISENEWSDPEEAHRLEDAFRDALRAAVREHMPLEHVWQCDRAPELDVVFTGPQEGGDDD